MSIRDLEILAGSVRRRKFTRVDKEAIVSETLNGDTSVSDVARRHEIDRERPASALLLEAQVFS
ncbi:transposase [Sinorhizobium meliloti]|uniref:transposase n=1 Tax=Rhizobium meliloti TaxID=382 RepID=UPI00237FC1E6|nr:transposase [Sinorhizobium meliloti]